MRRAAAEAMAETDPKTVQDLTAVVSAGGSGGARRPLGRALEDPLASPRPCALVLPLGPSAWIPLDITCRVLPASAQLAVGSPVEAEKRLCLFSGELLPPAPGLSALSEFPFSCVCVYT